MASKEDRDALRAQREADRKLVHDQAAERRRKAYTDKVRSEKAAESIERGHTAEDVKFVDDFFGMLGGLKESEVEKLAKSKPKSKAMEKALDKVIKNPRVAPKDKARAKKVRENLKKKKG